MQDSNIDKWNQIFFENANKYHTHQDNLRWTLSGGFAAFFYGSITLLHNSGVMAEPFLVKRLEIIFFILGTFYWIAVSVEGWYYMLCLRYLVECEEKLLNGENLEPITNFDRKKVKMFHPSFTPVLILIASANSFHLFNFSSNPYVCIFYVSLTGYFSVFGYIFRRFEMTKSKIKKSPPRIRKKNFDDINDGYR